MVLTVDQFVGRGCGKKQVSRVHRKTGRLSLIFRKNQSRHYINDKV